MEQESQRETQAVAPILPVEEREQLRATLFELDKLELELRKRHTQQGMKYYTPNPQQLRAHQSIAKTILFCGGNRSGKSTLGAMELCFHLTRDYPDWFPEERRFHRPVKTVVVATEYPIVERTIAPKILSYLPHDYIAKKKYTPQGYLSKLFCKDGSTVDVLTNEMSDMAFESADWDFYWGDEPQKKAKYYAIRRGLVDREGQAILTFTPLIEPWMKKEIVDKADGIKIETFEVDMRDNKFDVDGRPILSETAIKDFEESLPEEMRDTRIHGRFFHLKGVIFTEYVSSVHERLFDYTYPDPVICILDPHLRLPQHLIWAFITRDDKIMIDRESLFTGTVKELSHHILLTEAKAGYNMRRRLIDPNFGRTPNYSTGRTIIDELGKSPYSVKFGEADDHKETGIMKIKELLSFKRDLPLDPLTNMPQLYFHRQRVPKTIESIKNYQYDEWKSNLRDERDPKEKDKQKDTHGTDCVRYLVMSTPTYSLLKDSRRFQQEEVAYY